jgi:hypothetical protein
MPQQVVGAALSLKHEGCFGSRLQTVQEVEEQHRLTHPGRRDHGKKTRIDLNPIQQ